MIDEEVLRGAIEASTGRPLADFRLTPLSGGCINDAFRLDTGEARFFVKSNHHRLVGHFEAEAQGLEALRASGTSLRIPEVIAWVDDLHGTSFLVLEYLESARRCADFDDRLGRGLAELHAATDTRGFGFQVDGYCGATPQPNRWSSNWTEFYAQRRLLHQTRLAAARGLASADVGLIERLARRLGDWCDDDPGSPSALIHGDLWSGNVHVDDEGHPALLDPAAYFANREAEFGMMALFGSFSPRVYQAYQDHSPLAPGWRQRLDLYVAYHLLNHFVLFGGDYGRQAIARIQHYVT